MRKSVLLAVIGVIPLSGCIPALVGAIALNKSADTSRCEVLLKDNAARREKASSDEERVRLDEERDELLEDCK